MAIVLAVQILKIGTIRGRLAWPLRKDYMQNRETFHIFWRSRMILNQQHLYPINQVFYLLCRHCFEMDTPDHVVLHCRFLSGPIVSYYIHLTNLPPRRIATSGMLFYRPIMGLRPLSPSVERTSFSSSDCSAWNVSSLCGYRWRYASLALRGVVWALWIFYLWLRRFLSTALDFLDKVFLRDMANVSV